jgi:hypothetical protein
MTKQSNHADLAEDLIWGAKAIAADIGRTERQTYHLLSNNQLPAQVIGGKWVASRRALRHHFAQRLAGAGLVSSEVA